jgi:hypothetical protein
MSFKSDYNFGIQKEKDIYDIINNKFNDNIKQNKNKFAKFDFEGDKYLYELKSRKCNYSTYPTTLIPFSKCQSDNKKIIFLFNFVDGLYYIRYRKKIFDLFKLESFCRNRRSDYIDVKQLYYYIPIDKLKKIN